MNQLGQKYCVSCGTLINGQAEICPTCGVRQPVYGYQQQNFNGPLKDERWLACLLFCIFLGPLGVHRFYVGKIGTGILQLVTLGGCGIWYLIDMVFIIIGKFTDSEGNVISNGGL
ncbi:NINE protein [Sphingobacterium sp. SRCM116780]|uniref:TM2 domain-containing protein n=1 Tax=Sphingobacterium sp. SRCM116780 TaxID=2907623 RepID=UPI001F3CA4AF|nr:NINE protein [Sphingobacterium sp. SRCM116780]UIR57186.1 NINE protein [Sphingobacterium sp. SRCM116780]